MMSVRRRLPTERMLATPRLKASRGLMAVRDDLPNRSMRTSSRLVDVIDKISASLIDSPWEWSVYLLLTKLILQGWIIFLLRIYIC